MSIKQKLGYQAPEYLERSLKKRAYNQVDRGGWLIAYAYIIAAGALLLKYGRRIMDQLNDWSSPTHFVVNLTIIRLLVQAVHDLVGSTRASRAFVSRFDDEYDEEYDDEYDEEFDEDQTLGKYDELARYDED